MRPLVSRFAVALLLLAVATPLFAVSYLVPSDREMIQRSDDIVVATAVTSTVERTAQGGIVTRYILRIEDVLKGERARGSYLRLTEIGGELADLSLYVSGMPVYVPGRRYLVFSDSNADGEPQTWGLELGKFSLENDASGRQLALRDASGGFDQNNLEPYSERARDARGFMKYIRGIVAQRIDPTPTYFVNAAQPKTGLVETDIHALVFNRASYLVTSAPRWQGTPNASVRTALAPTGGINGVNPVTAAIGAWNGTPGNIAYSYFGQDDAATAGFTAHDSKSTVLYTDPNNEVCGTCVPAVLGRGGYWISGATYQVGGETFKAIDGGIDVVIDNTTFTQCLLNVVVLHEMGHTFGFRHSNQNPDGSTPCNGVANDCTSSAVMNSSVSCGLTSLQTWDTNAVATVYGAGPQCTNVSISGQPTNKSITQGQQANVTVTAAGTTPFTYQWYIGNPSDTSNLLAGQTTATLTHAPTATTTYWVRVSSTCNTSTADSNAVTVTVNPPACTPPSIITHPVSTTINVGQSAPLSVSASGTNPLTFQWFTGATGDTSQLAGTGNPISLSPTVTTRYWCRVLGQCDPAANSNSATITVSLTDCPNVTVGNPTATVQPSGQFLLDVTASSGTHPLTYQWFQGAVPGTGSSVGSGKQLLVPAPTAPTSYWVRVLNDCGKEAASPVVVAIAPCVLPAITTEPADQTIASGASASLNVVFTTPTAATVVWYRGTAPDKTTQVGTGVPFNTGALTSTTQFWAGITNTCGEKITRTLTITVGAACTPPVITSQPFSAQKFKGEKVTLQITATGTETLHYQWYEGPSGTETKPVGTDSSTFTSATLTNPTMFWVKATNACGSFNSQSIVIDVKPPKYRSVRH